MLDQYRFAPKMYNSKIVVEMLNESNNPLKIIEVLYIGDDEVPPWVILKCIHNGKVDILDEILTIHAITNRVKDRLQDYLCTTSKTNARKVGAILRQIRNKDATSSEYSHLEDVADGIVQ